MEVVDGMITLLPDTMMSIATGQGSRTEGEGGHFAGEEGVDLIMIGDRRSAISTHSESEYLLLCVPNYSTNRRRIY